MPEPFVLEAEQELRARSLMDRVVAAVVKTFEVEATGSGRAPATYVYASQWRACTRRMAIDVAWGHEAPPWPAEALARMRRGKEREVDLRVRLERAGKLSDPKFEVVGGEERFELKGKSGRVVLAGRTDCTVKQGEDTFKVEIKSLSPFVAAKIKTPEDFEQFWWTRPYPYQMRAYQLGSNTRFGLWVLDRGGLPDLMLSDLYAENNLQKAEEFLAAAELASETGVLYRETGDVSILPEFATDAAECARCPYFGNRCQPPLEAQGPALGLAEELVEAERIYWETILAHKQHEAAAETLKDWAKASGSDLAVVGDTILSMSRYFTTEYPVPKEVKQQFARKVERCRTSLARPGMSNTDADAQ